MMERPLKCVVKVHTNYIVMLKNIEKAKKVQKQKELKKFPYRRQIYKLYSALGITRRPHGNFLTYASNSQKVFDEVFPNTKSNDATSK